MRAKVPVWRVAMDVPLRLTSLAFFGLYPLLWPFVPWIWGSSFERLMGYQRSVGSRAKVGIASIPVMIVPRALPFVGIATVASLDERLPFLLRLVIGALVWFAASLVMYPLYAAPLEMLDRNTGLLDSVISATAKSTRAPLHRTLLRAFAVACAGALPWFAMPFATRAPAFVLVAMLVLVVASPTCVVAIVAHAWSDGAERFGNARTPRIDRAPEAGIEGPMRRRLAGALMLALTPVGVVLCTLLLAVLAPAPARSSRFESRLALASDLHPDPDNTLRFPVNSGLRTERAHPSVLRISTADGGGAGEVRLSCLSALTRIAHDEVVFRDTYRGSQVWTYRVTTSTCENRVSFSDEGVRLDDTSYDRITQRWGGSGVWVALALGLLCALAGFDQLRWLGRARNLDATSKEMLGTVAIEGRITSTTIAFAKRSDLTAPQGLRIDLGEHGVLTLPPDGKLTLLHPVTTPQTLVPGDALSIITTLRSQQGSPFRDAHAQRLDDVRIVPGSLKQAREAYVQFASRRVAITGLLSLAASLVFALVGLLHL